MPYPSYVPFMEFSESDEAREQLQFKYKNRAKESNLSVLDDIISKRRELVEVLGYSSYAEYRTEDRMAKNAENQIKKNGHRGNSDRAMGSGILFQQGFKREL